MSILYLSAHVASHPMPYENWVTGLITIFGIGLLLLWITSLASSKRGDE